MIKLSERLQDLTGDPAKDSVTIRRVVEDQGVRPYAFKEVYRSLMINTEEINSSWFDEGLYYWKTGMFSLAYYDEGQVNYCSNLGMWSYYYHRRASGAEVPPGKLGRTDEAFNYAKAFANYYYLTEEELDAALTEVKTVIELQERFKDVPLTALYDRLKERDLL